MKAKFVAAMNNIASGNGHSAANEIQAAINQIEAQRGKKIPDALATDLIASARFVLMRP